MAEGRPKFDFSKLNFFSRLDARSRVFVLFGGIIGLIFLFYLGTKLLIGGGGGAGATHLANAPSGLQSIPGAKNTPEYQRALEEANRQAAQNAQMSGTSAVPTMINLAQPGLPQTSTGCIICTEQNVNIKNNLDDWVKKGELTPEVAAQLTDLANHNVPVDDFAAVLDSLLKAGKLSPEQARLLLDLYKRQHANQLLDESAKVMDPMIKAGQLPIDTANSLLDAQKKGVGPADYAALLRGLVKDGKIAAGIAQQLLAQYTQQRAREITAQSIAYLHQMGREGLLIPDVEKALIDLENRMVPMDTFAATVQQFVSAGKLVPGSASKVLAEYKMQKEAIGPVGTLTHMIQEAEAAAYGELSDLLKAGKITQDVAALLASEIQKDVSLDEFTALVNQLVAQNKLTPEIAKLKINDYARVKCLRDMADRLNALQVNNATSTAYSDELKRSVQLCGISPDIAAELMQEYLALTMQAPTAPLAPAGTEAFARLQQQAQAGVAATQAPPPPSEFAAAQVQAAQESDQDRQARIQAIMSAMSGQAQSLLTAWQPATMAHREGAPIVITKEGGPPPGAAVIAGTVGKGPTVVEVTGQTIVKAGTIYFAVLDTAVNSDYPDTPVLATIVQGPLKGAKLLGKLTTAKNVAGQLDRIALTFTLINKDDWDKSRAVTAYAIDPDTARTVMASTVNYHYLKRYGAIMATSLLQGYANALQTSASTTTTGIFGTSTTHPTYNQSSKLLVALGQIGQNLSSMTQQWTNIPPTVRVDSGVSLGILFMTDVT